MIFRHSIESTTLYCMQIYGTKSILLCATIWYQVNIVVCNYMVPSQHCCMQLYGTKSILLYATMWYQVNIIVCNYGAMSILLYATVSYVTILSAPILLYATMVLRQYHSL